MMVARKKHATAAQVKPIRYLPMRASKPADWKASRPLTTHALVCVSTFSQDFGVAITYVMRAAASVWKNRAMEVIKEDRYPPRRLHRARRPDMRATAAKKRAMR